MTAWSCQSIARFVALTSGEADQASRIPLARQSTGTSCPLEDRALGHDAVAAEAPQRNQ